MQPFAPGVASEPTSRVEIALSATSLQNKDVFSKSDPFVVTYLAVPGATTWKEIHRTEVIRDSLNPVFASKIEIVYKFEEQQKLRFEVYDLDSQSSRLSDHDFLGAAECSLGQLVSSGSLGLQLSGRAGAPADGVQRGSLKLTVEEVQFCKQVLEIQFRGRNLDRKDWFGSADPFLEISRSTESGNFVLVHRTEVIKNTLKPVWQKFRIKITKLCNADLDRNLKFICWDWNRSGNHEIIGEFYTTARKLIDGKVGPSNEYQLVNEVLRKKKKKYTNSGEISVVHCDLIDVPSFLDYIRGGTELQCTFAIDFTASNGNPTEITSLHNITTAVPNQYEQAIRAVGDIIRDYDTDKMFPVLGFGARLPPDGRVSHEFFVNLDPSNPYCADINGVLAAYKSCIHKVQLYGPTNFAPVINHVAQFARQYRDGSQYFILLVITDGAITDMPQTKEAIVEASTLPLSIIIVGVGNAEFEAMEELDGDTVRISSRGRYAARDIVQFVPMRDFMKHNRVMVPVPGLPPVNRSPEMVELAKAVLAEIPDQFLGWMQANGVKPRPPKSTVVHVPVDPEMFARPLNEIPGFMTADAPPLGF